MGIGFLCPGQASQKVGMGLDLYENSTLGKQFFDTANDIMGVDIQHIIFNGPEEELKQTQFTQPAIYIVSVIIGMLMSRRRTEANPIYPTSYLYRQCNYRYAHA